MKETYRKIIVSGAELTGAAVAGVLGFLAGGPIGAGSAAITGVAFTEISKKLLQDVVNQSLSEYETEMIGIALVSAIEKVRLSIKSGKTVRQDGFFEDEHCASAKRVMWHTIQKVRIETDKKKAACYGRILAAISLNPSITVSEAIFLTRKLSEFSYLELCLLGILCSYSPVPLGICNDESIENIEMKIVPDNRDGYTYELFTIGTELFQLIRNNWVGLTCGYKNYPHNWININLNELFMTDHGDRFAKLAGLREIEVEELQQVRDLLVSNWDYPIVSKLYDGLFT